MIVVGIPRAPVRGVAGRGEVDGATNARGGAGGAAACDDTVCPGSSSWVPWDGASGRLNTDPPGDSQFFHRLAVDQTTGRVALAWYDTRGNASLDRVRFFSTYATSLVPLAFEPEFPVLSTETESQGQSSQQSLGDYTGIDFHAGAYFPAWANNSGVAPAVPDGGADVYTGRIDVPQ